MSRKLLVGSDLSFLHDVEAESIDKPTISVCSIETDDDVIVWNLALFFNRLLFSGKHLLLAFTVDECKLSESAHEGDRNCSWSLVTYIKFERLASPL